MKKKSLWIDLGTSSTKAIAVDEEGAVDHFFLNPCVSVLDDIKYEEICESLQSRCKTSSVLKYEFNGTVHHYLVGEWANRHGTIPVGSKKIRAAIPRILSLIGILCEKETVEIDLTVLLPYDEFKDAAQLKVLKAQTVDALSASPVIEGFEHNGFDMGKVKIRSLKVQVEGMGLYLCSSPKNAEQIVNAVEPVVAMCGHADFAMLSFRNGMLQNDESEIFAGRGFHDYLGNVDFGLPDELKASEKISQSIHAPEALKDLLTNKNDDHELTLLNKGISRGKRFYVLQREADFHQLNLSQFQSVIPGGGAYALFKTEFDGIFGSMGLQTATMTNLLNEISDYLSIKKSRSNLIRLMQFADIWGHVRDSAELKIANANKSINNAIAKAEVSTAKTKVQAVKQKVGDDVWPPREAV